MITNTNTTKYKVGDKVKIVSKRTGRMNPNGFMDKYLGTIMTIKEIKNATYKMIEDKDDDHTIENGWVWYEEMIDHEATANLNKKTAKLIIDGKEYDVTLTVEQVSEITKPTSVKVTGFERTVYGDTFWYNSIFDTTVRNAETKGCHDDQLFEAANYYTNEDLAEWCRRSDELTRKMRRWAAEHNKEKIEWGNEDGEQYFILYDHSDQEFKIYSACWCVINGNVYFDTYDNAEAAIAEFGDEIKWLAENRPEWF